MRVVTMNTKGNVEAIESFPNGMTAGGAAQEAQFYNIIAMTGFVIFRFVFTFVLKYIHPGKLLMVLAIAAIGFTSATILIQNVAGLYSLIGISACMSLMFPTIYGISLRVMGEDAKFGSAGLIMSIVGGSFLPKLQAWIIDTAPGEILPAVNISFVVPMVSFIVITIFGYRTYKVHI